MMLAKKTLSRTRSRNPLQVTHKEYRPRGSKKDQGASPSRHRPNRPIAGLVAALTLAVAVSGCANSGYGPKQTVGGLGGAALGGLLGSQVGGGSGQLAATAVGVLAGAFIGSEIGRSLDDVDKLKAQQAHKKARSAPIGETVSWNNPDSGNYGTVTPVRDGTSTQGRYCREFQQTLTVGGELQSGYGTACRQADGSWEIL